MWMKLVTLGVGAYVASKAMKTLRAQGGSQAGRSDRRAVHRWENEGGNVEDAVPVTSATSAADDTGTQVGSRKRATGSPSLAEAEF